MNAPAADEERLAALRLIRTDTVGPVTFREMLEHFRSATTALDALPELSRRAGRKLRIPTRADAEREVAALAALGGRFVMLGEPAYPPWLAAIDGAPPVLAVHGDTAILARPMIAIVGSRNASVTGRKIAATLARDLGARGLVIASGLARGIDAAAQEAALEAGTVAVLAGGLDRIYPPENQPLAERILASRGAHLTEMPLGWEPRARDFPRRNRIVSGLALGVVVVEAAERSGTLITARFAGEQGRVVFAVPGSPLDPRAAGTNRLLKEGATLVTEVDDIVPAIESMLREPLAAAPRTAAAVQEPMRETVANDRDRVLEALGPAPVAIDEVIRFTGLSAGVVQLVLIELSLAGRIERHAGQRVSLQAPD